MQRFSLPAFFDLWHRRRKLRKLRLSEPELVDFLVHKLGVYPNRLDLYRVALSPRSAPLTLKSGARLTNERLEYLGDAVLELAVSNFLFHRYPFREEGQLTQLRSNLVCRESFNQISNSIGLGRLAEKVSAGTYFTMRMKGDALEAFFGALFLDVGFNVAERTFVDRILKENINLAEVESKRVDPKSRLYIWAKRNDRTVSLDVEPDPRIPQHFCAKVFVDGKLLAKGKASRKKHAEQAACAKACFSLSIGQDF